MEGLALKIGDQWARLSVDTSITITEKSSVFDDGNAFSIPFQLDAEMNIHLLGNSTQVEGVSFYEAIDRKQAVLYVQGIPLFYGIIRLDDEEASLEDGCIDVNLESGNLSFDDMIDGMNCRDVPLIDKLYIGSVMEDARLFPYIQGNTFLGYDKAVYIPIYLPDAFQKMETAKDKENDVTSVDTVNVSVPYPAAKFCNIRICYKLPDKNEDGEDAKLLRDSVIGDISSKAEEQIKNALFGQYISLDENRKRSSPCFYVLYFLDCLFKHLGISFDNGLTGMEDMCRLAFVNTDYQYDKEEVNESRWISGTVYDEESMQSMAGLFDWKLETKINSTYINYEFLTKVYNCVANSNNFPDKDVDEVIKALKSGFGVRFISNRNGSIIHAVYIKDILRDENVISIPASIHDECKVDSNVRGFVLSYDGGDDDTSYNYNDYSNVVMVNSYSFVLDSVSSWNNNLYIDTRNGNAYRIKIDSEASSITDMNPVLFEVGEFNKVEYGDCSDKDCIEEVDINFTPVIMNDVGYPSDLESSESNRMVSTTDTTRERTTGSASNRTLRSDSENKSQTFAFFLDIDMMYPSFPKYVEWYDQISLPSRTYGKVGIKFTYFDMQRYDEKFDQTKFGQTRAELQNGAVLKRGGKSLKFENKSPIHSYDCGLTFGIMRGPGNDSGVEDYEENYDEEGNFKYTQVSSNSAFHSDTVDNYNRQFDYNGTEEGGVDVSGRFSLKLRAEKPNPEGGFFPITDVNNQKRGLFDKFYAEYAYFVTHRKLVKMKLRMEIADLLQIDWTKRYRIGNYTGFINKYEYTVTPEGIGEISMEMYVI